MKERPIQFGANIMRAILDGIKTQTRVPVKEPPNYPGIAKFVFERHPFAPSALDGTPAQDLTGKDLERDTWLYEDSCGNIVGILGDCPYGKIGDRLITHEVIGEGGLRINSVTLEIVDVRVERVQDINGNDAHLEGVKKRQCDWEGYASWNWVAGFKFVWDSIYTPQGFGWDTDPWVWVIEFRKMEISDNSGF